MVQDATLFCFLICKLLWIIMLLLFFSWELCNSSFWNRFTQMTTLTEYFIILPSEVSSCGELEPEVIRCLKLTLINSVKGIVKQIISLMHSWEATENYGTYQHKQIVPESLLKTVPKEWNYTPREMKRKESGKCGWNLYSFVNLSWKLVTPLLSIKSEHLEFMSVAVWDLTKQFPSVLWVFFFFKYMLSIKIQLFFLEAYAHAHRNKLLKIISIVVLVVLKMF